MRPRRPNGPRSRPWAAACVAVLVFACLAVVACDRSANETGWMVSIQLERADNGRVVLSGRTNAPDGLWVYVEAVGDPQRMQALAGEAIVVRGGTFSWVTPFAAPLTYRGRAVLSSTLNPDRVVDFRAMHPAAGQKARSLDDGAELIAETDATFGTPVERREVVDNVLNAVSRAAEAVRRDARALAGPGWRDELEKVERNLERRRAVPAEGTWDPTVYAPTQVGEIRTATDELGLLFRYRLREVAGRKPEAEKIRETAGRIERRVDRLVQTLEKMGKAGAP